MAPATVIKGVEHASTAREEDLHANIAARRMMPRIYSR